MNTSGVALILSALALGAAVFTLTRESPQRQRAPVRMDRITDLETQVTELAHKLTLLKAERPGRTRREEAEPLPEMRRAGVDDPDRPTVLAERDEALAAIVDSAVDRKTKQVIEDLRIKANKKPAMDQLAATLKLTREQRASAEQVVVEGQRQTHEILNIPTADGTNLMDELVEIIAKGYAQPGKDHGINRLFARIMGENMPGTNETYGARIESVKSEMRATFKRDWSKAQYKEFEQWGVDPTEIGEVEGSPNDALGKRIIERAKTLGAEIPDDE